MGMSEIARALPGGQSSHCKLQTESQTPPGQIAPGSHPTQASSPQAGIMERHEPGLGLPKPVLSDQIRPR